MNMMCANIYLRTNGKMKLFNSKIMSTPGILGPDVLRLILFNMISQQMFPDMDHCDVRCCMCVS